LHRHNTDNFKMKLILLQRFRLSIGPWQIGQSNHFELKANFANGAIGVKIWKNIGMTNKDSANQFIMIDNPRFDPIIKFIEEKNKTIVGHLGEPKNCYLIQSN